jgi:beta-galactosidase
MHQDFLGKAWAMTHDDMDLSLALIQEIGANAVRLGHYPFDRYVIQRADELGLVLWAEKPNGQKTTMDPCSDTTLSRPFVENARAQLQELIFQQFNHPSIAVWAVGNESDFGLLSCNDPVDTVRPYLQELGDLAKQLDPGRSTGYAEFGHPVQRSGYADTQEITDVFGTNRYFYWYSSNYQDLGPTLDGLHANAPDQALAITEYGIGAALSHHTDNPLGGYPDVRSVAEGQTAWQPEEFAAYAHEFNYKTFAAREYLFGTFVWNMFDFGSGHRREGDVLGVNTKGLVTFDRQTRKEPFFFYQANWSTAPVVHIVGHRYTDRAYAVNDINVYSNADSVELLVNGTSVGTMKADEADFMTYVFPGVRLNVGDNTVTAQGDFSGKVEADTVTWTLANEDVNIAAGMLATGLKSSEGDVFGSDNYFTGGTYVTGKSRTVTNTNEPDLYFRFRQGTFGYEIPLDDGPYGVKLGFIEPYEDTTVGERIFSVAANGKTVIEDLDPRDEAGDYRRVIIKEFTVDAVDGLLRLSFVPTRGQAVVSTIMVKRA